MKQQNSKIKILILCCIIAASLVNITVNGFATEVNNEPERHPAVNDSVKYDNSMILVRKPPAEKIMGFRNDQDYAYDTNAKKPDNYFMRLFWWISDFWSSIPYFGKFLEYLFYGLLIAMVILAVFRMLDIKVNSIFQRNRYREKIHIEEISEDIHKLDMDALIMEEIKKKNYKNAIRLLYLKLLKLLSDNGIILWSVNKTNADYRHEISPTPYHIPFSRLSALYEFIWYGNFRIGEDGFNKAKTEFYTMYEKINDKEK